MEKHIEKDFRISTFNAKNMYAKFSPIRRMKVKYDYMRLRCVNANN